MMLRVAQVIGVCLAHLADSYMRSFGNTSSLSFGILLVVF